MDRLVAISSADDIFPEYRNTPISLLLEYHNLGRTLDYCHRAQLLIGMCMDNRNHLDIPHNFSFIIRTGGANISYNEFMISYAISVGRLRHIALIAHDDCGMVNLKARKNLFVEGLRDFGGWDKKSAEEHFDLLAPKFETYNEIDFILNQARSLRQRYPKIQVAPMMYLVAENKLFLVKEF